MYSLSSVGDNEEELLEDFGTLRNPGFPNLTKDAVLVSLQVGLLIGCSPLCDEFFSVPAITRTALKLSIKGYYCLTASRGQRAEM